jgi:UDPglucose 6-dehydrogenase
MIDQLLSKGAVLTVFDPEAMNNVKNKLGDKIQYAKDMYEATIGADALVISTEWSIFRTPDLNKLRENLNSSVIFDGRNLYDVVDMKKEGFFYSSIGREEIK